MSLAARHGRDDLYQMIRGRLGAADHSGYTALCGTDQFLFVDVGRDQDSSGGAGALDVTQHPQHLLVDRVHDHDGDLGRGLALGPLGQADLGSCTQLTGHTGLRDRILCT